MITFHIERPDTAIADALREKIDNLTKPKGSLGRLEEIALQVGLIQQTLAPSLRRPVNVIFAADHGIVDGGVDFDFPPTPQIIDRKIRKGTRNFLHEAAMTREEMETALRYGAEIVSGCHEEGCRVISFGEMGIGNTAASSMWMTCLTGIPLIECVGAGSGLDSRGVQHKYNVLKAALEGYTGDGSTPDVMRHFGGYEMVMAVGGMLRAAELKMVVLVDGFIMTNCALAASRLYPEMLPYCIFCHCGDEAGHRKLLDALHATPILSLGMRLGEGSGAVCAFPIIDSAVRMINEMHTFREAAVTKYF